jgi:hypothetical protein
VSGVPQDPQKVRRTGWDEWNTDGRLATSWNCAIGKVSHATTGEPATRRHVRQWQIMVFDGRPLTR